LNTSNKFQCTLTQHECLGFDLQTKKKCNSKRALGFEYCDKHLKEFCHLEIKNSKVSDLEKKFTFKNFHSLKFYKLNSKAGFGVFAMRSTKNKIVFKKGNMIAKYNGEFLDNTVYKIRYKNIYGPYGVYLNDTIILLNDGPYAIYFNRTHTIDSACMRSSASLINHKKKREGSNAWFYSRKNGLFVYALRDIKEGEEIVADYGDDYLFENNFKTIN
jgi:SET domain-containing protein